MCSCTLWNVNPQVVRSRVGPARENERRPYRSRLYRGTTSNARSANRSAQRGTYGVMREAMYVGIQQLHCMYVSSLPAHY